MNNRLNILSLRNVIAFGGPDTTLLGWYDRIDRDRFNVSLACFDNPGSPENDLMQPIADLDIPTHLIPYGKRKNVFASIRAIKRIIRDNNIHLLHTHDHRSDVIGYMAARQARIPVMTTVYVWFSVNSMSKLKYLEMIQRAFLRRFDGITAICEATRRQTIDQYHMPAQKVQTVLSGIDIKKFDGEFDRDRLLKSIGARPDDRLLPFVARLWPEKAHTYLLRAMVPVVAEEPRAKLMIVGDGILREALENEARDLGIAANVIFTGIRRDVARLLKISEFMVHPSLAEGIPLAVYEGMAAGLAVVGTRVDGIPEVVTHEETGLLVEPKDIPALSQAILRLLHDRPLNARLGRAAHTLMAQSYSLDYATGQLEAYYKYLYNACNGNGSKHSV